MRRLSRRLRGISLALLLLASTASPAAGGGTVRWYSEPPEAPRVGLYLFWAEACPHCLGDTPGAGRQRFFAVAEAAGDTPGAAPSFYFCGQSMHGFDRPETTGIRLMRALETCFEHHFGHAYRALPQRRGGAAGG